VFLRGIPGPLFDSANNYTPTSLIPSFDGVDGKDGICDQELALLTGMTQDTTPIGPEGDADDPLPGLKGAARTAAMMDAV
jgi:hypothetical protein